MMITELSTEFLEMKPKAKLGWEILIDYQIKIHPKRKGSFMSQIKLKQNIAAVCFVLDLYNQLN